MLQAHAEFAAGDAQAVRTIREANEIARETPTYVLPFGLGLAAMIAHDPAERAAALAEGEAVLAAGAVSHNCIFFNRYAIEACIAAKDWAAVEHHAAALEHSMAKEPLPMTDFLVSRARLLAAAADDRADTTGLAQLIAQAKAKSWRAVLPALEEALAALTGTASVGN